MKLLPGRKQARRRSLATIWVTPLVAFPLALSMEWVLSPPFFSVATETATDLANERLAKHYQPPIHWLESLVDQPTPSDALPASNWPPLGPPPPHPSPL